VKPAKTFRAPSDQERAAMTDLAAKLKALRPEPTPRRSRTRSSRWARRRLRAAARLVLGALRGAAWPEPGPRFGSFTAIFGVDRTVALIERALAGELTAA